MKAISNVAPHLSSRLAALKRERERLRLTFEALVTRLDGVDSEVGSALDEICDQMVDYLDHLNSHQLQETVLLQLGVNQDVGGEA